MKVLIIGGLGFVGKNVFDVLNKKLLLEDDIFIFSRRKNFNLEFLQTTGKQDRIIRDADFIINCAANVGSLNYVTNKAAEIIHTNSQMILNLYFLLKSLKSRAVVINPIANCGFPGNLSLYKEENFWNGELHPSVLSYGTTRRFLLSVAKCYEMEHGIKSINYFVPNMYGEYDSTDPNKTHALNGIISKIIKAKHENSNVIIWGSGKPVREWLYAKDFGKIVYETIKRSNNGEDFSDNINVGQKGGISINTLLTKIGSVYDCRHITFLHDKTKQDGAPQKVMDDKKFKERFPNFQFTNFEEGIKNTINYYKNIYPY